MKTLFALLLIFSFQSFAQSADSSKKSDKKEQMDEGDKQLLKRDTCRKPIEALETKYPNITKEELEKMKSKCDY
jgi:hypothetical protein